jgi:alpha-beta hydrolase superfamily lysophospholipase
MKEQTGILVSGGGDALFRRSWLPDEEPAAALVVVHGYGEHGGRYQHLADAMVPRGYAVHVFDLRGHGRSPGVRGHVERFSDYVGDARLFVDAVAAERAAEAGRPAPPLFLLGHSLGGLIATSCAEAHPDGLAGLILSSPFLRLRLPVGGVKRAAARVLSKVAPTRDIGNSIPAEELSHEPGVVAAYKTDPLNHHVATARWAAEALAAQRAALSAAGQLRLPLLVMYAGADTIADPAASRELFASAASADKTIRCYDGYYHELFNEVGRDAVFADLAAWLAPRVPARPAARA